MNQFKSEPDTTNDQTMNLPTHHLLDDQHQPNALALSDNDLEAEQNDSLDPELILEQILSDPDLVQHSTRTRREGVETIVAYHRCNFSLNEQRLILHIPFSPPLEFVPGVQSMATDVAEVRVRITDTQKFGMRMEIILPTAATSERSVLIETIITATCANHRASNP